MIKKFKNGKIKLVSPKKDDQWLRDQYNDNEITDDYYHDIMFMEDISFNQINGYMYIVDFNTQLVYELESQNIQNPLKWLLDTINEAGRYYLYPLSKQECKELLIDLEGGY